MNGDFSTLSPGTRRTGYGGAAGFQSRRLLLVATLVTLALWFVPYSNLLLYPLRIFVTFIHESGHALATVLTGGSVESLTIFATGEGVTMSRESPFWAWLILSGGYLGTTLFGALLLQVGRLNRLRNAGRTALYCAAVFIAAVTMLWGWHSLFTLGAGAFLTLLLFALARYLPPYAADFLASFLAVQCCLNALGDIRILLYLTSNHLGDNDAVFMAQQYGLPATFWAALWALMAVFILALSLRSYWRATAQQVQSSTL